jgi:iron complex transport system substrate-binding protein
VSLRVVTLLPAATEIVCALGLREALVGRSHECDFPADVAALPPVTRARVDSNLPSAALDADVRRIRAARLPLYEIDGKRLEVLHPDVVVTQEACEVCAVSFEQVVAVAGGFEQPPRIVSLGPGRLEDVLGDIRAVAAACGVPAAGRVLVRDLRERLARAGRSAAAAGAPKPRVAVVEWLAPPMLAGHWTHDVVAAAGAEPLGPGPGAPSAYAPWDAIEALRPDAVVVAPCGFDLDRTRREALPLANSLKRLAPRVLLLDGNALVNRPGPRLVDAAEVLGDWLHRGRISQSRSWDLTYNPPLSEAPL